ncbi:MAG: hypothetical protein N2053_11125 [Chitinispirillaceae bacterium]|nr:hypothetical protein [Chitinispirillaceae bacterium]
MIKNLITPLILQLLGILVIIAEFILPSMGLLTVLAIIMIGYSLFLVFSTVSFTTGIIFLIIDICIFPLLLIGGIKILAASPVTLRKTLDKDENSVDSISTTLLPQMIGVTITDLHPTGIALFNGKRYDVISRGEFIEKNSSIEILSIEGNKIIVKKRIERKESNS